jgi:hypothetical protein
MVWTLFPYIEFLPKPGQARAVQIALHFATSLVRGEPNRVKIALTVLVDKVRQLV